jgi:predicted nucleic acid-binding protein
MSAFVDTSAAYALMVRTDEDHDRARMEFTRLLDAAVPLWTTSFVLVETMALLQHRVGLAAARDFDEALLPVLRPAWVDEALYRQGVERLWREDRRRISLVDAVSFEFMIGRGIRRAFAFDPHFGDAGFDLVPG